MDLVTIGEFAARTRLSVKALRLYDRLGLVRPARTDPDSGYRYYGADQVERARLVGLLRRLDMPLAVIADVLARPPAEAAQAVGAYWAQVESATADRRALVSYLQSRLTGASMTSYDIQTRALPERTVLAISAHVHAAETGAFFEDAFARLRAAGPGLPGIAGCPFLVFYGEVSDDSDGPLELCRPVAAGVAAPAGWSCGRSPPTTRRSSGWPARTWAGPPCCRPSTRWRPGRALRDASPGERCARS